MNSISCDKKELYLAAAMKPEQPVLPASLLKNHSRNLKKSKNMTFIVELCINFT